MQAHDLLKLVWSKLERPNSMCPDVELGHVRRVLGEAMAAEIKDRGVLTAEVDCWVLGQLLVTPMMIEQHLADEWYDTKHTYVESPEPPNGDYEDTGYCEALEALYAAEDLEKDQRATEVDKALRGLIEKGLVGMRPEGGHEKYFADPEDYLPPRWPDRC